jgi:Protein phosphatase 2C
MDVSSPTSSTTSPSSTETSPRSGYGRPGGSGSGRERPHPPPLDTAAANNLPRNELSSPLQEGSAVSPTPPADAITANANGRKPRTGTNAAGLSSPLSTTTFHIGVSEDVNKKCRRTMEDTHAYLYDFHKNGSDCGYFAIFDGHAGKSAAEYCGLNFHRILSKQLEKADPGVGVPEILDRTFVECDQELDKLSSGSNRASGCTAVVAYARWEDRKVPDRNALKRDHRRSSGGEGVDQPKPTKVERRRVLYTGNVGDARIVLW